MCPSENLLSRGKEKQVAEIQLARWTNASQWYLSISRIVCPGWVDKPYFESWVDLNSRITSGRECLLVDRLHWCSWQRWPFLAAEHAKRACFLFVYKPASIAKSPTFTLKYGTALQLVMFAFLVRMDDRHAHSPQPAKIHFLFACVGYSPNFAPENVFGRPLQLR